MDRHDYVVNGEALKALILKSTKTCSESYIILFLRFPILPTLSLVSDRKFFNISVDRHDYVVNGEALKALILKSTKTCSESYIILFLRFPILTDINLGFLTDSS